MRYTGDEVLDGGLTKEDGLEISRRLKASGMVDFLNIVRGHIDTDAGLTDLIPIQGMASSPHLDFSGEIRAATAVPDVSRRQNPGRGDGAARDCGRQGRHGRHDAGAHDRSAYRAQDRRGAGGSHSSLRRRQLLPGPDLPGRRRLLHSQPARRGANCSCPTRSGAPRSSARWWWSARGPRASRLRASAPNAGMPSWCSRPPQSRAARYG